LLAGILSFASPKESSQRKGDPKVGAGYAGSFRYSSGRAACQNSPAAQTRQAESSRPACVALRRPRGRKPSRDQPAAWFFDLHDQPEKSQIEVHSFSTEASPGPLEGAEQRRNAGGSRLALSEPQASLASRPAFRVAQGTGVAGTAPGSPFLCLLSFGEAKESKARLKRENQR